MFILRTAILGSAAALTLSLPAAAQSYNYSNQGYGYNNSYQQPAYNTNCEADRRSNQVAGGLFGAVAGGLLGAAIADNDDDDRYRRGNRGHHYGRGYDRGRYGYDRGRGYGYDRGYRGHHRSKNNNDQAAGAVLGAVVGGLAGSALGGSATNCNTRQQAYGAPNPYNAPAPTRYPYDQGARYDQGSPYNNGRQVTYTSPYQDDYDRNDYARVRPGEELYGGNTTTYSSGTTYQTSPAYGATTTGYNAGYTGPSHDSGECRTVYRGQQPATACNVGGDRWEFVD